MTEAPALELADQADAAAGEVLTTRDHVHALEADRDAVVAALAERERELDRARRDRPQPDELQDAAARVGGLRLLLEGIDRDLVEARARLTAAEEAHALTEARAAHIDSLAALEHATHALRRTRDANVRAILVAANELRRAYLTRRSADRKAAATAQAAGVTHQARDTWRPHVNAFARYVSLRPSGNLTGAELELARALRVLTILAPEPQA